MRPGILLDEVIMSQSKKRKGTLERVAEPVTDVVSTVVKTVKKSARAQAARLATW